MVAEQTGDDEREGGVFRPRDIDGAFEGPPASYF
jgi:hypothetical protein